MKAYRIVALVLALSATWAPAAQQTIRPTDSVRQMVSKLNSNFTEAYLGLYPSRVPYVGATNNVDLGAYSLTAALLKASVVSNSAGKYVFTSTESRFRDTEVIMTNTSLRFHGFGAYGVYMMESGGTPPAISKPIYFYALNAMGIPVAQQLYGGYDGTLKHYVYGTPYTIWSGVTDGSGSGMDSDLLDGYHGSSYFRPGTGDVTLQPVAARPANTLYLEGGDRNAPADGPGGNVVLRGGENSGGALSSVIVEGALLLSNITGRARDIPLTIRGGVGNSAQKSPDLALGGGVAPSGGTAGDVRLLTHVNAGGNNVTNVGVIAGVNGGDLTLTGRSVHVNAPLSVMQPIDLGTQSVTNARGIYYTTPAGTGSRIKLTDTRLEMEGDLYVDGAGNEFNLTDRGDGNRALYLGFGLHMQPYDNADIDMGNNDVTNAKSFSTQEGQIIDLDDEGVQLRSVTTNVVELIGVWANNTGWPEFDGEYTWDAGSERYVGPSGAVIVPGLAGSTPMWYTMWEDMQTEYGPICYAEDFPYGPWRDASDPHDAVTGEADFGGGHVYVQHDNIGFGGANLSNIGNIGTPENPVTEIYVSDGSIYIGGLRMSVSNGGISVTSTNEPEGGSMQTGTNGLYATGTTTWFEDLTLSAYDLFDPAGPAGATMVLVTNYLYAPCYKPGDEGRGLTQLKHQYKPGSTVYPHFHVSSTNQTRKTTNTWFLGMTAGRIGAHFTNTYAETVTVTNDPGSDMHYMPEFPSWTADMAESTIIGIYVTNRGPDTAVLLDVDIHIEGEKLGTDNPAPANP